MLDNEEVHDEIRNNLGVETNNAEFAKVAVIDRLVRDNYLTPDQGDEFLEKYGMVIIKTSWYKKLFTKENIDKWVMKCVKM